MMFSWKFNRTSARLLLDFASEQWGPQTQPSLVHQKRYVLANDLYIKARSYALLNKTAFVLAFLLSLTVLCWPALQQWSQTSPGIEKTVFQSAMMQTTVTGLAALTFALYSHYKKRQQCVENLLRQLIYTDLPPTAAADDAIIATVLSELARIDAGFSFSDHFGNKDKGG